MAHHNYLYTLLYYTQCQFSHSSDPDYRSGSTETSGRPALLYEARHGFSDPVNESVTSDDRDDGTASARSFSLDKQRLSYPASSIRTAAVLTTSSLVPTGFGSSLPHSVRDHSTAECHVPLKREAPQANAIAGAVSDLKILVSKIRVRPFNLCAEQVVLCATKVSKMKDKCNIRVSLLRQFLLTV